METSDRKVALSASEATYRRLFETMMDAFVGVDMEGRIRDMNPAFQAMLGYSAAELRHLTYAELTPDNWHAFESRIVREQILKRGYSDLYEKEYRKKDGTIFPVELRTLLVRDDSGQPTGMWAIIRDITQRKQTEQALRETDMRLRESQQIANLGSYVLDIGTGLWKSSEILDSLFGIGPEYEHSVSGWINILHPDERAMMAEYLNTWVVAQGHPFNREYRIIRQDTGITRWVHGLGRLEFDAGGRPARMLGTIQDITERKLLEQEIANTARRLETILAAEPECVKIIDHSGRLLEMNPAGLRMLQADSLAEVQCRPLLEFIAPEYRTAFAETHQRVMAGQSATLEFEAIGLKGQRVWLETHAAPLRDPASGNTSLLGVTRDITRRKQAEAEREQIAERVMQSQKIESLGRLAGGVAHDFNNMLGVILGHAEMAMGQVDKSSPLFASLEEIEKAAQRSANLTRQLLAFGRKQIIAPIVIDLNETVSDMHRMLLRLIGAKIDLVLKPRPGLWRVRMDPSQIDMIIVNLCLNARDAMADSGQLTIETMNVNLDKSTSARHPEAAPGDYVMLSVSDTGSGMDQETLSHIFEPFFTTKEVGKGTGLGLSTVYGIIKQNNGFIDVHSEPGHGTTFKICLPRHHGGEERTGPPVTAQPPRNGTETILLVEDEPTMMAMTRIMLEKQGYKVLAASTPGEAVKLAEAHRARINLLLTDVIMPEMDGRALANILQRDNPVLPCLFMSAYAADFITNQGILDTLSNFIQKPFTRADLTTKIREALDTPRHARGKHGQTGK